MPELVNWTEDCQRHCGYVGYSQVRYLLKTSDSVDEESDVEDHNAGMA